MRRALVLLVVSFGGFFCSGIENGRASVIDEVPDANVWGVDGQVFALVRVGDVIYLGGTFSNLVSRNGLVTQPAHGLAAINVYTGQPTPWRPWATGGGVYALAASPDGETIYAGGTFTEINRLPCGHFAALPTNGGVIWSANANSTVRTIAVRGDTVYLGGFFTQVDGVARYGLAAVKAPFVGGTKAVLQPWNAGVSYSRGIAGVYGLAIANGDLVAVGIFDKANWQWNPNQARFDAITGAVESWAYHEPYWTRSVTTDGRNFYGAVAGPGGKVVAWDPSGTMLWRKAGNGDVQAIAYCGGQIIAGGHFTIFDGMPILRLLAMDRWFGALDMSWAPSPDTGPSMGVWAICNGGGKLHVGGEFRYVGDILTRGYAQFTLHSYTPSGVPQEPAVPDEPSYSIEPATVVPYEEPLAGYDNSTDPSRL